MDVSREDVIVSALSSLLGEKLCACEDFNTTERFGIETACQLLCRSLERALEAFDELIFAEHDPAFSSKGFESRSLLTCAGPVNWRRRRYTGSQGAVYLADEALDICQRAKVSPLLCSELSRLALDQSYRSAAEALRLYVGASITKTTVARALKTSSALLAEAGSEVTTKRRVPFIDVEADGTYVALQRTKAEKALAVPGKERAWREVSVMVAYEGKKQNKNGTKSRINTLYHASSEPAPDVWIQFKEQIHERWDTTALRYSHLATDGADKYEAGIKHLPAKVYAGYDLHHITSALSPAFGAEIAREIYNTMKTYGFNAGFETLNDYAEFFFATKGDEACLKARDFIAEHASAIKTAFVCNLGTIESTNAHLIGSRLKRFGGGWRSGLEPMVRLRSARASGTEIPIGRRRRERVIDKRLAARRQKDIEITIAELERKATGIRYQGKEAETTPLYYHQVQLAHSSSHEANHSLLHLWN